jgi:hypothetical protein
MNHDLYRAMQNQLSPSQQAREQLSQRLAQTSPRPRRAGWKYASLAACAVLVIAAYPVYRTLHPPVQPLHSYVTIENDSFSTTTTTETTEDSGDDTAVAGAIESKDNIEISPENTPASTDDTGFTQAEIADSSASPEDSLTSDIPVQERALNAYYNLMDYFQSHYGSDNYPDWYGGAYLDGSELVVNIVSPYGLESKDLFLQIYDWAGDDRISFGETAYSLSYLRQLQNSVDDAMLSLGLDFDSGVNEETGQLELTLSQVTDEALAALAQLDPKDDAILVQVGGVNATTAQDTTVDSYVAENADTSDLDGADYSICELPVWTDGIENPK